MTRFHLTPVGAAALLTVLAISQAPALALAQTAAADAPPVALDTVIISGVRKALKTAEEIKRDADQVVDVINAEDIGKFPDKAIGEALQRVAGVQVFREKGEVSGVLIRGLPDVVTSVNGNEIFTGNGRRLSFQDMPVDGVAGLDVYKSATVSQFEGGIGGAINVRLRKPFDFKGLTASAHVNASRVHTPGSAATADQTNPSIGGLLSNRWSTDLGEVGLLVDASYVNEKWANVVQWNDTPNRVWSIDAKGDGVMLDGDGPYTPAKAGDRLVNMPFIGGVYSQGKRERPTLHAALQWKPNDKLEINSQLMRMTYKARYEDDFLFSNSQWGSVVHNVVIVPDGPACKTALGTICPVVSATMPPQGNPVDPFTASSTQAHDQRTTTDYLSVGLQYRDGPLSVTSDLAYNKSKFSDDRVIIDQNVPGSTLNIYTVDGDGHGGFAISKPGVAAPLKDPSQFTLRGLFQSWGESLGKEAQWRTDAEYKLGGNFFNGLNGGVRLAARDASFHGNEGGPDTPGGARPIPVSIFGNGFNTLVPGIDRLGGSFQTANGNFLLDNSDTVRKYYGVAAGRLPDDPMRLFEQTEKTLTGYLAARWTTTLAGIDMKGNFGARLVSVKRTLNGNIRIGDVTSPLHVDTSETNVLPNFSAVVSWTDKIQSHFSVGKTITRPDFASLNPALSLTPSTINRPGYGGAGNPLLKPVESISTDATVEYYFDKNGYVQVALFDRRIDGYMQNFTQDEAISGQTYTVSRPQNSGKANLRGAEFSLQKFFDFLPAGFDGLGAQLNYTLMNGDNKTKTSLNGSTFISTPLTNVSKNAYNIALLYEKFGISGRLAASHRGEYTSALGLTRFVLDEKVKAATYVDLSVSYEISKNLSVNINALNLTKANYESYLGDPQRPRDIRYSPTFVGIGLSAKL